MKRNAMNVRVVVLCVAVLLVCSSCQQKSDYYDDEQLLDGIEYGQEEMFCELFNACNFDKVATLGSGDTWRTKHFTLKFTEERISIEPEKYANEIVDSKLYLEYDLTLKDITIEECFEDSSMFFYIYSVESPQWEREFGGDDYYLSAYLDDQVNGNNCKGTIKLAHDAQMLVVIIVIDGCYYAADYSVSYYE